MLKQEVRRRSGEIFKTALEEGDYGFSKEAGYDFILDIKISDMHLYLLVSHLSEISDISEITKVFFSTAVIEDRLKDF